MAANTALVTGATGLLGRQVVQAFARADWKVIGAGFSRAKPPSTLKIDLGSQAEISKALAEAAPSVVVHCAANKFPDKCDSDPEGTRALNIEASRTLARLLAASSAILIYISTDYVFPGTEGDAPYETTAKPSPPNLYGQTKLDGEKAVLDEYEKAGKKGSAVALRVPILYGKAEEPKESAVNVLMDAVKKAQDGVQVAIDHWALRYPTNTEDVGRVCKDIATLYLSSTNRDSLPTILQFSSEDRYTKYQICELFADIMGISLENMKASTEGNDPNASVQRPYDCHLSTKALKDLGIDVSTQDFLGWWRWEGRAFRH